MRAKNIEEIREHLKRGGQVSYRDEEWSEENEEVIRSLIDRGESEEGIHPSRWELVPIEEETPEERQAWIEKAEHDFPINNMYTEIASRLADISRRITAATPPGWIKQEIDRVVTDLTTWASKK